MKLRCALLTLIALAAFASAANADTFTQYLYYPGTTGGGPSTTAQFGCGSATPGVGLGSPFGSGTGTAECFTGVGNPPIAATPDWLQEFSFLKFSNANFALTGVWVLDSFSLTISDYMAQNYSIVMHSTPGTVTAKNIGAAIEFGTNSALSGINLVTDTIAFPNQGYVLPAFGTATADNFSNHPLVFQDLGDMTGLGAFTGAGTTNYWGQATSANSYAGTDSTDSTNTRVGVAVQLIYSAHCVSNCGQIPIPEPTSLLLFGSGLTFIGQFIRRRLASKS